MRLAFDLKTLAIERPIFDEPPIIEYFGLNNFHSRHCS